VHHFTLRKREKDANPCFKRWKSGGGSVYCRSPPITRDRRMSWLDIYLVVLFLALVGLLVAKFRG
jgi:hypothetical protein